MNSLHNINDFKNRVMEQKDSRKSSNKNVIAFIDGVDESLTFKLADCKTPLETFSSMFLQGIDSKIYSVFRACGLSLDSFVVSLRQEFLEKPIFSEYVAGNLKAQTYRIQKMENREVIKNFKSLKVLRRLDKKEDASRHQTGRYPSFWEERRYIKRFREILDSTPDSIFHYPMFIRYAYRFMCQYWDQWNPYMKNLTPESNMALSFQTLLDAIFKWEFHVYYEQKQGGVKRKSAQEEEKKRFVSAMEECLKRVLITMPMIPGQFNPTISRNDLEKILAKCAYGKHDHLVIAHCVLSCDESGRRFSFCHSIFYEYYLARFILKKGDYKLRKDYLLSPLSSEFFRQMYYALLCQDQSLSPKLYNSIGNVKDSGFHLSSCLNLQKAEVLEINDNPSIPVIDILSYLPFASRFLYHGAEFSKERVEDMMDGTMELSGTGWNALDAASGLAPCERVKNLILYRLPLESAQTLNQYKNLTCLDIRLGQDYMNIVMDALQQLKGVSLEKLYLYCGDGSLCAKVQEALDCEDLQAGKVFVETPEFSAAHVEIYRLKCKADGAGKENRFFILNRTALERAKDEYNKSSKSIDYEVLRAVFELEADENGCLGLRAQADGSESAEDATLWNGLTLAKYYKYIDSIDEEQNAYQIYCRLEPKIRKSPSALSLRFGYEFGRRNETLKSRWAKDWLTFVNENIPLKDVDLREIDVKMFLFKSSIRCGDTHLDDLKSEIENLIKESPSYMDNSNYCWFLRTCCAQLLQMWKKETLPPETLTPSLQQFLNQSEHYAQKENNYSYPFSAIYFRLVYMNRTGDTDSAKSLLEKLTELMPIVNQDDDERSQQARHIQYMEQKLYFLYVSGRRADAIAAADDLLSYPHRKMNISSTRVQSIRDDCAGDGALYVSADKHILWNDIWF